MHGKLQCTAAGRQHERQELIRSLVVTLFVSTDDPATIRAGKGWRAGRDRARGWWVPARGGQRIWKAAFHTSYIEKLGSGAAEMEPSLRCLEGCAEERMDFWKATVR